MALPIFYSPEKKINSFASFGYFENGGKGSGNFGHKGRPGERGGSGEGTGSATAGDSKSSKYVTSDANKKSKINPNMTASARVGVPGDEIPETVPLLKGLTGKQKEVESKFAETWNDPEKREQAVAWATELAQNNGNTFETDAIKQLYPEWGQDSRVKELQGKVAEGSASDVEVDELNGYMSFRQEYNTALHQTANVIAKEAFKRAVSAKDGAIVLITSGGCGSGKGYGLSAVPEIKEAASKADFVWDAAGDQNGTELNWASNLAKNQKSIVVHTVGEPLFNASSKDSGLVSRALQKGRMVDVDVYAESYTLGNKNFQAFYEANKGNSNMQFFKFINGGKGRESYSVKPDTISDYEKRITSADTLRQAVKDNLNSLNNVSQSTKDAIWNGANLLDSVKRK